MFDVATITFPEGDYPEFIRNVRRLFPETKLIFMVRGPLETIWSMSQRKWGQSFSSGDLRTIPLEAHVQNWNACMEVIAAYQADPNVYVSSFEKLITEPAAESARIRDFLGLGPGPAFTPRETKTPGFSADEQAQILEQTAAAWSAVFTGIFNGSPQTDTGAVAQGRSAAE